MKKIGMFGLIVISIASAQGMMQESSAPTDIPASAPYYAEQEATHDQAVRPLRRASLRSALTAAGVAPIFSLLSCCFPCINVQDMVAFLSRTDCLPGDDCVQALGRAWNCGEAPEENE